MKPRKKYDPLSAEASGVMKFARKRNRYLKPKQETQAKLPNVDWKFYLPDVCIDCNGTGRLKKERICPTCKGNCFIPNKRTMPEEEHQLEIPEQEKWSKVKYRVKAFDKVAQGHFASATFDNEDDALGFAQWIGQWNQRFSLIRIEAVKEMML